MWVFQKKSIVTGNDDDQGFIVGFYSPGNRFFVDGREYANEDEAAAMVNYLNGGAGGAPA